MLTAAIYISNHGFGHASRMSALAEQLETFGVYCHIISEKPAFLFTNLSNRLTSIHRRSVDVGVKHGDNLVVDLPNTKRSLLQLMGNREQIVAQEVAFVRNVGVDFIIADIPFIVAEIATYAQIPVYAVSNFDWYYIYSILFKDDDEMVPVLNCIWSMYQSITRSLLLPFSSHESTKSLCNGVEVGLLARKRKAYSDLRKTRNWDKNTAILLVMFGGEGDMDINMEQLCSAFQGVVISTFSNVRADNHYVVDYDSDFVDLIYNADIIVCKPGYSTLAEATQFGKAILYCQRGAYPEEQALLQGLVGYTKAFEIPNFRMNVRQWKLVLRSILSSVHRKSLKRNDNSTIAGYIVDSYLKFRHPNARLLSTFDLGTNTLNYTLYDLQKRIEIHNTQITTKLGRGLHTNIYTSGRITGIKKLLSSLLDIDRHINGEKQLIATGVNRVVSNANDLLRWFESKYGIRSEIISPEMEYKYVYYASRELASEYDYSAVAIDIGGASTEVVLYQGNKRYLAHSIPIGLLDCINRKKRDNLYDKLEMGVSSITANNTSNTLIGVGLTYTYLAAVILQNNEANNDYYHGVRINKNALKQTLSNISERCLDDIIPYLSEPQYLEILVITLKLTISLLDKLGISEIVVCAKGISSGYALWRSTKLSRLPESKIIKD